VGLKQFNEAPTRKLPEIRESFDVTHAHAAWRRLTDVALSCRPPV
jgi:hypothetical protein